MSGELYSLSVEELILSFYVMGCQQAAAEILSMSIGQLSDEELGIRMLTAGHSLAARDWLDIDEEAGTNELDPRLEKALRPLADAQLSLRLSKWEKAEERVLGIHLDAPMITIHAIEKGIVHRVQSLSDEEALLQCVVEFFSLPSNSAHIRQQPLALQQFEQLSDPEQAGELPRLLVASGMEPLPAVYLADDLQAANWSSVTAVGYTEEREPFAQAGFLLLHGDGRFWLFRQIEDGAVDGCTVEPGTHEALRRELLKLLKLPTGTR